MATVVEQLPKRHRGRPPKYDWDRYSDGRNYRCVQGVDFDTSPVSFRALVHRTADARGLKAETRIDKAAGAVLFRIYDPAVA